MLSLLPKGHLSRFVNGAVKAGPKDDIQRELMKAYNLYAVEALAISARVDRGEAGAREEMFDKYPQVVFLDGSLWVKEVAKNAARVRQYYELRTLTGPDDPEIVGLRNPVDPTKMNYVRRPVASQ